MEEQKPTKEQLQSAYNGLCAEAGHKSYQLHLMREEVDALYARIKEVNKQYAIMQEAERALAAKPEEKAN